MNVLLEVEATYSSEMLVSIYKTAHFESEDGSGMILRILSIRPKDYILHPEDEGSMFLQNVVIQLHQYTGSQITGQQSE
jgi:hypothetical protein